MEPNGKTGFGRVEGNFGAMEVARGEIVGEETGLGAEDAIAEIEVVPGQGQRERVVVGCGWTGFEFCQG